MLHLFREEFQVPKRVFWSSLSWDYSLITPHYIAAIAATLNYAEFVKLIVIVKMQKNVIWDQPIAKLPSPSQEGMGPKQQLVCYSHHPCSHEASRRWQLLRLDKLRYCKGGFVFVEDEEQLVTNWHMKGIYNNSEMFPRYPKISFWQSFVDTSRKKLSTAKRLLSFKNRDSEAFSQALRCWKRTCPSSQMSAASM